MSRVFVTGVIKVNGVEYDVSHATEASGIESIDSDIVLMDFAKMFADGKRHVVASWTHGPFFKTNQPSLFEDEVV